MLQDTIVTMVQRRARIGAAIAGFVMAAGLFAGVSRLPAQAGVTSLPLTMISHKNSNGWLGVTSFSFTAGTTSIQLGTSCPSGYNASSGAYALNSVGQTSGVYVTYNGPRIDENPVNYNEYGWHFYWPGGSPSGTTALFDVYCVKS